MSVLRFHVRTGTSGLHRVSILILMDVCLKDFRICPAVSCPEVSILILMDVCLKEMTGSISLEEYSVFQSLF